MVSMIPTTTEKKITLINAELDNRGEVDLLELLEEYLEETIGLLVLGV